MSSKQINLFHKLPWTGLPSNALGLPWTMEIPQAPSAADEFSRPQKIKGFIHLKNCFGIRIASTEASRGIDAVHYFAMAAMKYSHDARRIIAEGNQTSWDYTVVAEIPRMF